MDDQHESGRDDDEERAVVEIGHDSPWAEAKRGGAVLCFCGWRAHSLPCGRLRADGQSLRSVSILQAHTLARCLVPAAIGPLAPSGKEPPARPAPSRLERITRHASQPRPQPKRMHSRLRSCNARYISDGLALDCCKRETVGGAEDC